MAVGFNLRLLRGWDGSKANYQYAFENITNLRKVVCHNGDLLFYVFVF